MTITDEMPITTEDVDINAERKSVQLSAKKFHELITYVDQLESTLHLCELDLKRERNFVLSLLSALRTAYKLLHEVTSYYGHYEQGQYYDLRSRTIDEMSSQCETGDITLQQFEQMMKALDNSASRNNGVAEGGVSG